MARTYIYAGLHTRRNSGALKHHIHLTNAIHPSHLCSSLLCNLQALLDILPPPHRNRIALMRKPILYRKLEPPGINIRNHDLLRAFQLGHRRTQQAHRPGPKHHHRRILLGHQTSPIRMQRHPQRLQ